MLGLAAVLAGLLPGNKLLVWPVYAGATFVAGANKLLVFCMLGAAAPVLLPNKLDVGYCGCVPG